MGIPLVHTTVSSKPQVLNGFSSNCSGLKSVPASLTLGGVDSNRFESHDVSFDLDPGQNPVVAINQISVAAAPFATSTVSLEWPSDSIELLGPADGGLYTIDSSTPYLWLPETVCSRFEKALSLTYDDQLQLYIFTSNTSQHEALIGWNLTFNFLLADLPGSSRAVSLNLPYTAFDLQLTYPFPGLHANQSSPPTQYFPLRKAANSTQYTLGRAFLQETYLTVDYERNNFSISQAIFNANAVNNKRLVDISRPNNSTFGGPETPQRRTLGKSAIAGVAAGASICFLTLAILAVVFLKRQRRSNAAGGKTSSKGLRDHSLLTRHRAWRRLFAISERIRPCEVDGCQVQANEAPGESEIKELPANVYPELPGSKVENAPYEGTRRKLTINIVNARGYDPQKPVELHGQCSPAGHLGSDDRLHARTHVVSLPYSPSHVGSQITQTIGISDRRRGITPNSSQLSSPAIVSPLTPEFAPLGYTNNERGYPGGSNGDTSSDNTNEGSESRSDGEHDAEYQRAGSQSHKFSWEEHR